MSFCTRSDCRINWLYPCTIIFLILQLFLRKVPWMSLTNRTLISLRTAHLHSREFKSTPIPFMKISCSVGIIKRFLKFCLHLHLSLYFSGYDDIGTEGDETLTTDNIESLPISPYGLLINVDPSRRSCDNKEIFVPTSNESKSEKRLFCNYCKKHVSKLYRHLMSVHKKENEVKRLINWPKGNYILLFSL